MLNFLTLPLPLDFLTAPHLYGGGFSQLYRPGWVLLLKGRGNGFRLGIPSDHEYNTGQDMKRRSIESA